MRRSLLVLPDAAVPSDPWALAYLCGRARAFRRGKLSLANVAGAIRMARARQVRDDDVREQLAPFGLEWNGIELRDTRQAVGEVPDSPQGFAPITAQADEVRGPSDPLTGCEKP